MPSALLSLDTDSEKPWSGLLTLRFAPALLRTQQSTCFPPQPPATATLRVVCSLWWVSCVPLYQHGLAFHPQKTQWTFGALLPPPHLNHMV